MTELSHNTAFQQSLLEDKYRSQIEILEGSEGSKDVAGVGEDKANDGTMNGTGGELSLSMGLQRLLVRLASDHEQLAERIGAIQRKYVKQREAVEGFLQMASAQTNKLSKAEGIYRRQLEEWSAVISHMNSRIEAFRRLAKAASLPPPAPLNMGSTFAPSSTGLSASGRSPFSSSQLRYSHQSHQQQQWGGSPARGSIGSGSVGSPLPKPPTMMHQSPSVLYSPISRFSTPHAATWRSPQQDEPSRLTATPSSLASPLPSLGIGGGGGMYGGSAVPPPLSSLSVPDAPPSTVNASRYSPARSLQSYYHSNRKSMLMQQQLGQGVQGMGGMGGMGGIHARQSMQGQIQQATIVLSQEDQEAMRQLLSAQTELLESSKETVKSLERRLAELQVQGGQR